MRFDWKKIDDGLESVSTVASTIGAIFPAVQPIALGLNIVSEIVESDSEGVGIDNEAVINYLDKFAGSKHNTLKPEHVEMIKCLLKHS